MRTFHESKYRFEGYDKEVGLFKFRSRHERVEDQEIVLVKKACFVHSNGSRDYLTPETFRLVRYSQLLKDVVTK